MTTRRQLLRSATAATAWLAAGAPAAAMGDPRPQAPRVAVLGVAQDAGRPQLGCTRRCCIVAREDPSRVRRVACLGLMSGVTGEILLVDATPDLRSQAHALRTRSTAPEAPGRPVDGILLSHAHTGHYTGLIHLGREAAATRQVPVHATERMCTFLRENKPWSRLVEWGYIDLRPLEPGSKRELTPDLAVEFVISPHRDEDSDTVGFVFTGPSRKLLYVPDTDRWSRWDRDIRELVASVDVALLDGTFYDAGEVPWRDPAEIPHPTIKQSMDLLGPVVAEDKARILFIHMNHTNPALDAESEASAEIASRGFGVAAEGMEFSL